eukprot:2031139-Pleurochrysis_carterae.AAC.1
MAAAWQVGHHGSQFQGKPASAQGAYARRSHRLDLLLSLCSRRRGAMRLRRVRARHAHAKAEGAAEVDVEARARALPTRGRALRNARARAKEHTHRR